MLSTREKKHVAMTIHAQTERLILREWSRNDIDAYADIIGDAEVMKYIGNGQPRSRKSAEEFVDTMIAHQESRGWNRFAVEHRNTGELVGFSGLDDKDGVLDFGWRLHRKYWGAGYGYEASAAALWVARNTFSLTHIVSQSFPENAGSVRIMQKMGMVHIGSGEYEGRPLVMYGFAEEWPDGLPG